MKKESKTLIDSESLKKYSGYSEVKLNNFKREIMDTVYPDKDKYFKAFYENIAGYEKNLWQFLMRTEWMDRQITWKGKTKMQYPLHVSGGRPMQMNYGLADFYFTKGNHSRRFLYSEFNSALMSYADDVYPNFAELDGTTYEFPFPYTNMNLECLFFVHMLDVRMDLLAVGEKERLNYFKFIDLVLAYGSDLYYLGKQEMHFYQSQWKNSPKYVKLYSLEKNYEKDKAVDNFLARQRVKSAIPEPPIPQTEPVA